MTRSRTIKKYGAGGPPNPPQRRTTLVAATEITTFSGPLPHPDALAKYDQILPGLAGRIVALTERQSEHRQALERDIVQGNGRVQSRGQILAFILVVVGMLIGGGLILADKPTAGFTALLTPLGLVALAFFVTRGQQARELARKRTDLEETGRPRSRADARPD